MSRPRSSPTYSACRPSSSARTSTVASTPAADAMRSIRSRTRAAGVSGIADIGYRRRPDRFFFLRGGLGGGPPDRPDLAPVATGSFSAGLARPINRPSPPPVAPFEAPLVVSAVSAFSALSASARGGDLLCPLPEGSVLLSVSAAAPAGAAEAAILGPIRRLTMY